MMSRITLNLRKAAHKRHTRFTDSSEDTPEHGFWFWFHRLFPGLRRTKDPWLSTAHAHLNSITVDGNISDIRFGRNAVLSQTAVGVRGGSFDVPHPS